MVTANEILNMYRFKSGKLSLTDCDICYQERPLYC